MHLSDYFQNSMKATDIDLLLLAHRHTKWKIRSRLAPSAIALFEILTSKWKVKISRLKIWPQQVWHRQTTNSVKFFNFLHIFRVISSNIVICQPAIKKKRRDVSRDIHGTSDFANMISELKGFRVSSLIELDECFWELLQKKKIILWCNREAAAMYSILKLVFEVYSCTRWNFESQK